ncbi:MAG: DUF4352 domain-containing protein [Armatimonadota bacterium]
MSRLMRYGALLAMLVFALSITTSAATKKTPAKKTTTKTPHYVQGTTQLKGEYAEFGKTYTLGKNNPFNITLKSAEYTIDPVNIGDQTYVPTADEKLIVYHMTYHNPQPNEYHIRWDNFSFTVVDPQSQNHDGLRDLGMEKDKQQCSMSLKPAQKVDVYGVMPVPSKGEMPKLIIKSDDDLVLRYDLRGKVKGLPAEYTDPADKTNTTVLDKIPAKMGVYYPLGELEVKLDKIEINDDPSMGEQTTEEGEVFLVAYISVKNVGKSPQFMRWDTFDPAIVDTDGVETGNNKDMFQKSKDRSFSAEIQPGQEVSVRSIFTIPEDTDLKSLSMHFNENKTFVFDISSVKS